MQATRTFGGSWISTRFVVMVVALLAVFLLGGTGGYIVRGVSLGQTPPQAAAAPASISGVDSYRQVRGGVQTGDNPASSSAGSAAGTGAADACILVNGHKAC